MVQNKFLKTKENETGRSTFKALFAAAALRASAADWEKLASGVVQLLAANVSTSPNIVRILITCKIQLVLRACSGAQHKNA